MTISNPLTVVALVNGMIGGIILVMPILALNTGYLLIAPVTIFMGFCSYYSCLLCLKHLRNYADLDQAILKHFNNKRGYKIFYDIVVVIGMSVLLILYFSLICDQWQGMVGSSRLIPLLNAIVLFPIVYIMKKYDFGATLLGYGILSIIGYCIFLIWMLTTSQSGQKHVPAVQHSFPELAAALQQGFAIQIFFIPVLKDNGNVRSFKKLLLTTYIIGIAVYTYIGYSGAFSIVNRTSPKEQVQTIQDFFGQRQWQVITLQILYLVHLYSAFPQFLLVAKKRYFSIFGWLSTKDVTIRQVIFVAVTILIGLIIKLLNISVEVIIELNGSIISFMFIYLIPIALHIKCVYFTKHTKSHATFEDQKKSKTDVVAEVKEKQIELPQYNQQNQKKSPTKSSEDNQNKNEIISSENQVIQSKDEPVCGCDIQYSSKAHRICQLLIIGIMLTGGILIMGYTLKQLLLPKFQ